MSAGGGGAATLEAADRASAIRALRSRGVTPVKIEAVGGVADEIAAVAEARPVAAAVPRVGGRLPLADLAMLIRELATAISAGLPMVQALRTIARSGRKPRQKAILERVIGRIEEGKSLADACAAEGRSFNDLTINLMRAGDASGKLDTVLMQAADLLDRDLKLRRSVLAATLYPMILAGLISAAILVIVTVIVPKVVKNLGGQSLASLPWPTRVVQGVADFFGTYWWAIIPAVVLAGYGAAWLYRQPRFRLWFDRTLLGTPLLGRVMRDVAVARFTRTLGTLTSAGIPAVAALRITKGTLGNKAMEGVIDRVCEQVTSGQTLAEPMEKSGYFPPMLVQIVNLGERSGRLDQLLNQAAGAFEDRTEMSVKLFMTALPPLLVVALAGVVGFVVMAILLPLLQMQESLG
jgi:type II secretory pathway component PulF